MQQLIKRATQIIDPIAELNPKDSICGCLAINLHEHIPECGVTIKVINHLTVFSGVNKVFNRLRVFPCKHLRNLYPDMLRDGEHFYDKVNLGHQPLLADQYSVTKRIIARKDWEMSEMHPPNWNEDFWSLVE